MSLLNDHDEVKCEQKGAASKEPNNKRLLSKSSCNCQSKVELEKLMVYSLNILLTEQYGILNDFVIRQRTRQQTEICISTFVLKISRPFRPNNQTDREVDKQTDRKPDNNNGKSKGSCLSLTHTANSCFILVSISIRDPLKESHWVKMQRKKTLLLMNL